MHDDPIINEVRKTREGLSKKYNYDVSAIFDAIRKRQALLDSQVVKRRKIEKAEQPNRDSAVLHPGR